MKRVFKALGLVAAAMVVAAGVAVAQGPPRGSGHVHGMGHHMGPHVGSGAGFAGPHFERHLEHLADALELTAEQRTSLDRLREELTSTVQPLIEQKHEAMRQLHESVEAGTTDACALGQLVLDAHGNDGALRAAHDRFEAGLLALLTPEQASQYEAIEAVRPRFHHGPPAGDDVPEE